MGEREPAGVGWQVSVLTEVSTERIAIVGSRNFADLDQVRSFVDDLPLDTTVISGGAAGVDKTAIDVARARGLNTVIYRPQYERNGRGATFIRNREIARECDRMVAFHDGKSRGTLHAIECARKEGKEVEIIY